MYVETHPACTHEKRELAENNLNLYKMFTTDRQGAVDRRRFRVEGCIYPESMREPPSLINGV